MRLTYLARLLLVLLAASGVASAQTAVDPQAWRVVQSVGDVSITAPEATISKPKAGTVLPAQSVVVTGSNGRAVLSRLGQQIVVQPNSRLEMAPDTGGRTVLKQTGGVASFKVDSRKFPHFQVDTPFLAAVVKGTRFEVRVQKDNAEVSVFAGKVEVSSIFGRANTLVMPGALARVSEDSTDTIHLQERGGKKRVVTVNEASLGTGDRRGPDNSSTAPDLAATVDVSGGNGPGANGASGPGAQDNGAGLSGSSQSRTPSAPPLRLSNDTSGPSNRQETTLQFSQGANGKDPASPATNLDTKDKTGKDNGTPQSTTQPASPTEQGGNPLGNSSRNGYELPGTSTRNSFLNTHQFNMRGNFPWWDVGLGALAILSLLLATAIRGWNQRRKERRRQQGFYDY